MVRFWKGLKKQCDVVNFYGHKETLDYCQFSNFFKHAPFEFEMPEFLPNTDGVARTFWCDFSEKAIMACKADLMGDVESFNKIVAAKEPGKVKGLGRKVNPWD